MIAWSFKASQKRIVQEFRSFITDFTTYHASFKSCYSSAIAEVMQALHGLDCLDPEDTRRIWSVISDAARCYYSVNWWPLFREAIRKRYRMQAAIAVVLVPIFVASWNILPKPRTGSLTDDNIIFSVTVVGALLIVGSIFQALIPYRYRTAFLMTGAGAALLAIAKFPEFQRWSSHILPARRELASPFTLILWLVALVCIVIIVRRSVIFWGKVAVSGLEFGYGRPAEECAELILGFLEISRITTELLDRMQGKVTGDEDILWLAESKLPSDSARRRIERHLDQLAFHVRKPWRLAMRSRNGSAGLWIASQAPRIEFFIRFQQSKNMLAGNNLIELRNSMTSALVQAADGNWHLIGSEAEYSPVALVSRWKMMIRRSFAIAVPILGAVAAAHFLRAPYVQVVVLTCLTFAGVQLFGLIDPDSPARLDVAGRVASMFKHGNG